MYIVAFILVLVLLVCYLYGKGSIKFVKSKSARAAPSPPTLLSTKASRPAPLLSALLSSQPHRLAQATPKHAYPPRAQALPTKSTRRKAKETKATIRRADRYQAKDTSAAAPSQLREGYPSAS